MIRRVAACALVAVSAGVLVVAVSAAGGWAAVPAVVGRTAPPCPHGKPIGPHEACVGPVTHHTNGGGGVVTIVVAGLVGVAVAIGALVLVRRRIAEDAAKPRPAPRPRRPS